VYWEDEDEPRPAGRRPWLLIAALAPWVVVGALLLRHDGAASAPTAAPAPAATAPALEPTPSPLPTVAPTAIPTLTPVPAVGNAGGRVTARPTDAVGIALAAARAHLSTLPAPLDVPDLPPTADADRWYVEHLVAEAIDAPGPGSAVVTVLAMLLPADGDRYGAPVLARLAVPVVFSGPEPRLAGAPWRLAPPELEPSPPATTEPVDDPRMVDAATAAVQAAGYAEVTDAVLSRTDGWPWVLTATARPPGGADPTAIVLWLRPHLQGFAVAGAPPTTAPPTTTTAPTTTATTATPDDEEDAS
jgi:hypothetical protein